MQCRGENGSVLVVVVVDGGGVFSGAGSGDAADVLNAAAFEGDGGGEEQGVEGGAIEAFTDERAGAEGDQERGRSGGELRVAG